MLLCGSVISDNFFICLLTVSCPKQFFKCLSLIASYTGNLLLTILKLNYFYGSFECCSYYLLVLALYLRIGKFVEDAVLDLLLLSVIIFIYYIQAIKYMNSICLYCIIKQIQQYQQSMEATQNNRFLGLLIVLYISFLAYNVLPQNQHRNIQQQFHSWCQKYDVKFDNYQYLYRLQVYKLNKDKVQQHNKKAEMGKSSYFLTMNKFAAFTQIQFKHQMGMLDMKQKLLTITTKCTGGIEDAPNPPKQINWTNKAVSTDVMQQGKCGANWAFTAVAAVEGLYAIKNQKFVKFSDQQLIDCSDDYGNEGCGGGFMDQAFWYMIDKGLANNKTYPYNGKKNQCTYSQSQKVSRIGKCAKVPINSYEKLISAVIQQPVSVAIASQKFMLYDRGIYNGDCTQELDRGMLLVGYGEQDNNLFWILKNSLGISWGEKGYMRLKRQQSDGPGLCGIQLAASIPQGLE